MRFAAIAICAGLGATVLASNLQSAPILPATSPMVATVVDGMETGSIRPAAAKERPAEAIRLIDLQSGATCKMPKPENIAGAFRPAPIGPDCAGTADLKRVTQWRTGSDGTLEMADASGAIVFRFIPGDGVLFESVFPNNALVTIVPARG